MSPSAKNLANPAASTGASARDTRFPAAASPISRAAMAWAHSARFLVTASRLDEMPAGDLPEIAFVGRSNAGKSSAINALAQHRGLAFASKTPGRTQHINLFALGPKDLPDTLWADLPGYGYAAVERAAKLRWQEVMADYLAVRRALSGIVLLVDSRLGFTDLDQRLLEWIAPRVRTGEVKLIALLTKADKLTRRQADQASLQAQDVVAAIGGESADLSVSLFSALSRQGVDDVAVLLREWSTSAAAATRAALHSTEPAAAPSIDIGGATKIEA